MPKRILPTEAPALFTLIRELFGAVWDGANWVWATHDNFIVNAIIWGMELRYLQGPDIGDQWQLVPEDSGDSLALRQWDDSASAVITRMKFIGKGTTITDEGDCILLDRDGTEWGRWDQSAGRFVFAGTTGIVLPVKTTTGDPASPAEGQISVNTFDNTVRVYADAVWRDLATW